MTPSNEIKLESSEQNIMNGVLVTVTMKDTKRWKIRRWIGIRLLEMARRLLGFEMAYRWKP